MRKNSRFIRSLVRAATMPACLDQGPLLKFIFRDSTWGPATSAVATIVGLSCCVAAELPAGLQTSDRIEIVLKIGAQPPHHELRYVCDRVDQKMTCEARTFDQPAPGSVESEYRLVGEITGNPIEFDGYVKMTGRAPTCALIVIETTGRSVITFNPNGTLRFSDGVSDSRYTTVQGCPTVQVGSTYQVQAHEFPGRWRVVGPSQLVPQAGADVAIAVAPTDPQQIVLVAPDGKTITINLAEWNGGKLSVQQMGLVKQFQLAPPGGSDAAKAGAASYTLNVHHYPPAGPNVPIFVGAPSLDQGAQAAASAAVEGAQAAASWVKANPGKASLAALGLAVSIAMPYTVAFQASAAGMTFFESAGIGFMTAAAPSAVSSLVTSAISGEGFWKTTGKAVQSGVISGAESLVSTTVGAGVTGMVTGGAALTQKLVGTELSEAAVTGFGAAASGVAGTATDLGVGILHDQVAEQIANSATAANIADLVTPSGPAPAGGLVLPFHSRALSPGFAK